MQFFSLARKDNYVYLWDRRNIDSFIQVYENRLYGNQRTGISQLGSVLFLGTENGTIVCKDIATSTAVTVHDFATNKCISSICSIDDKSLICSLGQRSFALQNGK